MIGHILRQKTSNKWKKQKKNIDKYIYIHEIYRC